MGERRIIELESIDSLSPSDYFMIGPSDGKLERKVTYEQIAEGISIDVDTAMSSVSENPVQNKVITSALATKQNKLVAGSNINISPDSVISATLTVDSAMSTASENPVQNKVITAELDGKQGKLTAGTNITISAQNEISAASVTVDNALSTVSANPVQNKVITEKINEIEGQIPTGNYMEKENPTGWGSLVSTSNTILDKDGEPTSAKIESGMLLWGSNSTIQATTASDGQTRNAIVGGSHVVTGVNASLVAGNGNKAINGHAYTILGDNNAGIGAAEGGDLSISIIGNGSSAMGNYTNILGSQNNLLGTYRNNTVVGDYNQFTTNAQFCYALGSNNKYHGNSGQNFTGYTVLAGNYSTAAGTDYSGIFGHYNQILSGNWNNIIGNYSTAMGGGHTLQLGNFNQTMGAEYNTVIGYSNTSYKNYNYSFGESNQAQLSHTVTIGSRNTIQGSAKDTYDSNAYKGIIIGSKNTAVLAPGTSNTPDNMIIGNQINLSSTSKNNLVIGNTTTASNLGIDNIIIGTDYNNISGLGYGNIVLAPFATIQGGDQKINRSIITAGNNSTVNMSAGDHYGDFITGSRQKFNANGDNEGVTVLGAASTISAHGYGGLFYGYNNNINCSGTNEGSIIGGWFTEADLSGYMSGSLIGGYGTTVKAHTVRGSILWGSQSNLHGPDNDRCTFDRSAILAGYTTVSAPSILDSFVAGAYHNVASTSSLSGLTISGVHNEPEHDYQTLIGYGLEGGDEAHQTIIGKHNTPATNVAFAIGNGASTAARSNAFTVDWNGNTISAGDITFHYNGNSYSLGTLLAAVLNATSADSGKVLGIDGNGQLALVTGGGGGSIVSFTQIQSTGTKIGTIGIDGVDTDIYAPTGGSRIEGTARVLEE